jgi:hypothetical protein
MRVTGVVDAASLDIINEDSIEESVGIDDSDIIDASAELAGASDDDIIGESVEEELES